MVFKQLFQARAIDVCQIDACRIGGVNEAIAVLLLAAKFGIPVCPHAGGVGLCEYVQHLAVLRLHRASADRSRTGSSSGSTTCTSTSAIPRWSTSGRYVVPLGPGYSIEMLPSSLDEYEFPAGPAWAPVEGAVGGR